MVQMNFETVNLESQYESRITLNDLPEYAPDHIEFRLVTAPETNPNNLILDILRVRNS